MSSTLALMAGHQEGHLACKIPLPQSPKVILQKTSKDTQKYQLPGHTSDIDIESKKVQVIAFLPDSMTQLLCLL